MSKTLDEIKFDAIFDADANVFNTLRKELKHIGMKMQRNMDVGVNSDYFEGREVQHVIIDGIPMYYKKISSFATGSGIKLHIDMIKGEMPLLYEHLFKLFKHSSGPEFYTVNELKKWFDENLLHILNNKKLQSSINIGVLERSNVLKFKDFNK